MTLFRACFKHVSCLLPAVVTWVHTGTCSTGLVCFKPSRRERLELIALHHLAFLLHSLPSFQTVNARVTAYACTPELGF
jgi:hypothetical protein